MNKRLQRRVCPFFLGQFQTGGGTVQTIFTLGGFRSLFGFFLCLVLVLYVLGAFQYFFGLALGIRRIILFRLPAGNVLHSAVSLIFYHQTVTGLSLIHIYRLPVCVGRQFAQPQLCLQRLHFVGARCV